ncbi:MAG: sugar kinase [Clostridia bacterium]|nr:sugar kinase [Clostridia bacterium]
MLVCYGEILMRLSAPDRLRFPQAGQFDVHYGGAEANVAAAYVQMGGRAKMVTKLPEGGIGDAAVGSLRAYGIDCSPMVRGGDRIGIYFLEKGASYRPSQVIYDRKGSSISKAARSEFDWEAILDGADDFFFTGITPAVSDPVILLDALQVCRKRGIRVWCDVNYRATLWSAVKAGAVMTPMMSYVDVLVVNEEHARDLFGITPAAGLNKAEDRLASLGEQLKKLFGCSQVVLTARESLSADDNEIWALLYADGKVYRSSRYKLHIVDRVGGGDALSAALIYTEAKEITAKAADTTDRQRQIDFACAANALKHSIEGDILIATADEVAAVMAAVGEGGRVRVIR